MKLQNQGFSKSLAVKAGSHKANDKINPKGILKISLQSSNLMHSEPNSYLAPPAAKSSILTSPNPKD